ncbi:MAG: hypothetical protein EOP83_31760 [Verrucomicrobiaceae bacterium]|nr:MAG: hypothetical protein EOP83_31760 [Verrucomicrobiaceae bacterium]
MMPLRTLTPHERYHGGVGEGRAKHIRFQFLVSLIKFNNYWKAKQLTHYFKFRHRVALDITHPSLQMEKWTQANLIGYYTVFYQSEGPHCVFAFDTLADAFAFKMRWV